MKLIYSIALLALFVSVTLTVPMFASDGGPIPTCGGPQKPCGPDDDAKTSLPQTTTVYNAVRGTVHPYPAISFTMNFSSDPYSDYAFGEYGSGINFFRYYTLPDGTTLTDGVFSSATTTTLPGYRSYQVTGTASGTDSNGVAVTVFVIYKYHVNTGRYGGLIFDSGSITVTK